MRPIFIKVTFKNLSVIEPTRKIIPFTTRFTIASQKLVNKLN